MKFSLIICTYQRPKALLALLQSVKQQKQYPDQILIVDGSLKEDTQVFLGKKEYQKLEYFRVTETDRGLTRQRNFGISKVAQSSQVVFFLDDDVILSPNYFEEILKTYKEFPEAQGVSGYISNETDWRRIPEGYHAAKGEFAFDGWVRKEGSRFTLRRKLGLAPDKRPGFMPDFSHGYSTGFLPPSGKVYEAEMLMGGIASYRKSIFEDLQFSQYFEGYGLYEDADFSLRAAKIGKLYVNTNATLEHLHDEAGRPNNFRYGKMVVRNGWYVWRVKNPKPFLKARIKWNATILLLLGVRLLNSLDNSKRRKALPEGLGRLMGWFSILIKKPR